MQVDARPGFESVDFRVGIREFCTVAAENAGHGFVQHSLYIDDRNGVGGGQIARNIRWWGGDSPLSLAGKRYGRNQHDDDGRRRDAQL